MWLTVALFLGMLVALQVGRYPIAWFETLRWVRGCLGLALRGVSTQAETILLYVRLPRILIAALIGASLSLAGAAFQGLFRNAIVSPDLLGASSGAGFGASLAILYSLGTLATQLAAFAFGVLAVSLAYAVSRSLGRGTLPLLLSGVAVTALFTAFTSITKLLADPANKLPAITFWLMGGLTNATHRDLAAIFVTTLIGAVPLLLIRWRLNIVALGEDHALALGVSMSRIQPVIVACATLLTASSVAICGMIGWVGLLVPNMARAMVGPRFDRLLPASMVLGALFVLAVDTAARSLWVTEIPIGILFSLLGAPFLLMMLRRQRIEL
jgi:iron complex transport system permease protein